MQIPPKETFPFKADWAETTAHQCVEGMHSRLDARRKSAGSLEFETRAWSADAQGKWALQPKNPFGQWRWPPQPVNPYTIGTWHEWAPGVAHFRDSPRLTFYLAAMADIVRAYRPVQNAAKQEFALGLFLYIAAHEMSHGQHQLKQPDALRALPEQRQAPVDLLLRIPEAIRRMFVERSVPQFLPVGPRQPAGVAQTALGRHMALRQDHLAGVAGHYVAEQPGHPPHVYENMAMAEVIAHWGAMTELALCMERGGLPAEASGICRHILDSTLSIAELIEGLPAGERTLAQDSLLVIEGGFGDLQLTKTPILADRKRLLGLGAILPASAPVQGEAVAVSM